MTREEVKEKYQRARTRLSREYKIQLTKLDEAESIELLYPGYVIAHKTIGFPCNDDNKSTISLELVKYD